MPKKKIAAEAKCFKASDANSAAWLVHALADLKKLKKEADSKKGHADPLRISFGEDRLFYSAVATVHLERPTARLLLPLIEKLVRDQLAKLNVCGVR